MAYKDVEDRKAYHRKWYTNNREHRIKQIQEYQQRVKDWIREIKSDLSCLYCKEEAIECLDFHHRDPKEKDVTIAAAVKNGWGKERILKEIEKCDVLCANCHRKLHAV